jgi:lipopolysaccharide export system protein LptC
VNTRQVILVLLLLAAIVGYGWFLDDRRGGLQEITVSRTGPDSFVSGMHLDIMDDEGRLHYRIIATDMTHYPSRDLMELSLPLVDMRQHNDDTWRINARRGTATDNGDRIDLLGNVGIHRSGASGPLQVRTSHVVVAPKRNTASTDSEATITSPGYRIDAVGFNANFRRNTLELRNRVRTRIDATS